MNVGYVRLSKDDNKRNYISIEHQKLIIEQSAAEMDMNIERWYEDDGYSGYKFNRPGFSKMMDDLEAGIDVIFVKDLSRLGRNNGRVLSLLDELRDRGKRFIAIDDDYDSDQPENDIIGIKTWYNERYVKDTSKKIRRVLGARQKEGNLLVLVPFGYVRNQKDKEKIEIIPEEAKYVKMIYELYLQGSGYRKISAYLNEHGIPTPSMMRRRHEVEQGKMTKRKIFTSWSDGMVKNILDNDFYTGSYRLHKRERATVHGSDRRVPKEKQYLWNNHHPAIIDRPTFDFVQEIKAKRIKNNYRGDRSHCDADKNNRPFGSCLLCKDCGRKLTPIVRTASSGQRHYYICSTYNTKGKLYCKRSHLIEETDLLHDVLSYVSLCRDSLRETISTYDMKDFHSEEDSPEYKTKDIQNAIQGQKHLLTSLFSQKLNDINANPENTAAVTESYSELQNNILARIHGFETQLEELKAVKLDLSEERRKRDTALDVIDRILKDRTLDCRDVEALIDEIAVDENGLPEIKLKYGLSGFIPHRADAELNRHENDIIISAMRLVYEDDRGFTSAKYLSSKLSEAGYKKSRQAVLPYIRLMIARGILASTDNPLKPYDVVVSKEKLWGYIQDFHNSTSVRRYARDGI